MSGPAAVVGCMVTRRRFLASTAAGICAPGTALAGGGVDLRAGKVEADLGFEGKTTPLWGFNGTTPGPTIRARRGDRLRVRFRNGLEEASALHWHGIRIDNRMDGVPGLTQPEVAPGEDFLYDFTVPDAGTFWYHSHHRSWEQVARGLYGALVVEEGNPPPVDHDIVVLLDDWRLAEDGSQMGAFENMHDRAHDGRLGNWALALFRGADAPVRRNQRVRLRLMNVATDRVFPVRLSGVDGKVVAHDGMPLGEPETVGDIVLAPAQRTDVIADVVGDSVGVDFMASDRSIRLGELPVDGVAEPGPGGGIAALEPNRRAALDMADAVRLTLNMEGGAMSPRMMEHGDVWSFNGVSGMPEEPLHRFRAGQTAVIDLVNDTRFAHGIHLHGHHFEEVAEGSAASQRDTILVDAEETRRIACVMDNPGKWLLHCHMLSHQASGMKTWIEVV